MRVWLVVGGLGLVVCLLCVRQVYNSIARPGPEPSRSQREFAAFFPENTVVCYRWTEVDVGSSDKNQGGGLAFLRVGNRVFSKAWPNYGREWPSVEGAGVFSDARSLSIAYRSADITHDFYYAQCDFVFATDGESITCTFKQKINDPSVTALSPGSARASRLAEATDDCQRHIRALQQRAREAVEVVKDSEHCDVLHWQRAHAEYTAEYEGKTYHFCCPACLSVFVANPGVYVHRRK